MISHMDALLPPTTITTFKFYPFADQHCIEFQYKTVSNNLRKQLFVSEMVGNNGDLEALTSLYS